MNLENFKICAETQTKNDINENQMTSVVFTSISHIISHTFSSIIMMSEYQSTLH